MVLTLTSFLLHPSLVQVQRLSLVSHEHCHEVWCGVNSCPWGDGQQNAWSPGKQEHGKILESFLSSPRWRCGDWPLQLLASEMSQGRDSMACTGACACVLSQVVQGLLSVLLKSILFVQYPWRLLLSQLNYVSEFEPSVFQKVPYQSQLSLQFRSLLTRSWCPVTICKCDAGDQTQDLSTTEVPHHVVFLNFGNEGRCVHSSKIILSI